MHHPKDEQGQVNIYRKYSELALVEYQLGNVRHANTLYRRGRKFYPQPKIIAPTIRKYAEVLGITPGNE